MPAKLFTENPPVEIVSKLNAEIDSIYINDKSPYVPHNTGNNYIAQGKLPLKAAGTLQVGQNAILELECYPSTQYDVIQAHVAGVSTIPNEDSYLEH